VGRRRKSARSARTAEAILGRLVGLFPDFAKVWESTDNHFREDDGTATPCGVFSEFSYYFQERYEQFSPTQVAALGRLVTECVASPDADLGDAAATCFLENVAGEISADFRRHLSGEALTCYLYWDHLARDAKERDANLSHSNNGPRPLFRRNKGRSIRKEGP
jgi:hypothetical protein